MSNAFEITKAYRFRYMEALEVARRLAGESSTLCDVTLRMRETSSGDAKGCRIVFRRCTELAVGEVENIFAWVLSVKEQSGSDGRRRYEVRELEYGLLRLTCENVEVTMI